MRLSTLPRQSQHGPLRVLRHRVGSNCRWERECAVRREHVGEASRPDLWLREPTSGRVAWYTNFQETAIVTPGGRNGQRKSAYLVAWEHRKDGASLMSESKNTVPIEAGEHFSSAVGLGFEDAAARRLRYHLLRLSVVGLTKRDVDDLGELRRLAFQESDVTQQAAKIKQRPDASSLAFAVADILERAGRGVRGPVSLKAVMFGTILGAYTSLAVRDADPSTTAILGAIGGAVAMSTSTFIHDNINRHSWAEYLRMQD